MSVRHVIQESADIEGLSFLWLEITAKCNLECIHCYADSGPHEQLLGEVDGERWLDILREAATLGCRQVQFIGGEPTLHPDLPGMVRFAGAHDYDFIEIYTNATHVTDDLLRLFVDEGVSLAVSFYSDDPEVHDAITKRRGSFRRTVANLERITRAGLPVRAGIIETQQNPGHGERAKCYLENIGITDCKIDVQRGIGRGAMVEIDTRANQMGQLCGECWKGKLCVTSTGAVYPCVFSRFEQVGTAADGIAALVEGNALASFRRELRQYREALALSYEAGCDPNCSPCQPGVFKCVPQCNPGSCRPTSADLNSAKEEMAGCDPDICSPCTPNIWRAPCGPQQCPPTSALAVVADCNPRTPCNPSTTCSPSTICHPTTCSPCSPDTFRGEPPCRPSACSPACSPALGASRAVRSDAAPGKGLPCEG